MKSILKNILVSVLGSQVKRLRKRNQFKIIGVTGSIGKTSTKMAIAKVLESGKRVRYQEGNYNDIVSVPLVFFGEEMPSLWNIFAWTLILIRNEFQIYSNYPFEFVVLELGADHPGDINKFRKYLYLDIGVVTAVTLEHMEFFKNLEEVVAEEFSVAWFADVILVNRDLCKILPKNLDLNKIVFYNKEIGQNYEVVWVSPVQFYSVSVAVLIAREFNIPEEKIKKAVKNIKSFPGRMQRLQGIKNSIIIDDTYNASPEAMKIALQTLYSYPSLQRIAILGMMNELGAISEEEHKKVGELCDPKLLELVVTIGKDANEFLAPIARANGCIVYEAKNAIDAGEYVKSKIKSGAVILAKGSQNGVFAEESLKPLLADPSHSLKLVRQDSTWMKKKVKLFSVN